ncbi:MocR-like pyridoxine biosynthesis transcription factor PdxR [Paenibacillus radicis (ex Gao et al. 2016)]|uniref:GntR family transcriptional regulator n=1 Tax=Paenibacillus radicis (ex Gao et al. 2016) TaxID=1737354 RepID=A0A917GMS4_9BACL|nr:PLP-dependent aminotransferase family protein [Paenibacillus radicis (ex Gao et al. 2016)]GGG52043.1 GntR family transcriptional regulator [Paenibacillus radicis (ex Gao et al. 2016)]
MPNPSDPFTAADTKTKQIYALLRARIFQGRYEAGSSLPSTRDLASELGVSRALIVEVYEQLIAEGYLEGRRGSGTYVLDLGRSRPIQAQFMAADASAGMTSPEFEAARFKGIDFRPSFPALEQIPHKKWKEVTLSVYDHAHSSEFGYDEDPAGNWLLRNNICRYLLHVKGIQCSPSQVVVTAGATQAIALLCRLLLKPGDAVAIEDPTANFIHAIFASTGADIVPVPVDDHGLCVDELPTHLQPKCVFVTPSHQFPFGSILSISRRIQLLDYARQTGGYIIEDDYDSEFRYAGMPVHALRELDSERVVYVGTFSKNLYPSLRLGYMVVPQELLDPLLRLKRMTDMQCPTLSQVTLAHFIADGHLERHISRMKRIYGKRRIRLITALTEAFGSGVNISGDAAGLHLIAKLSGRKFDSIKAAQLEERNIKIYPAEKYTIAKGKYEESLIMGFGNVTEAQITEGIKTIADLL